MLPIGLKPIVDLGGQCCNPIERYSRGKSRKENLLKVCTFPYPLGI